MKVKKIKYYSHAVFTAIITLFGISFYFIYSDVAERTFQSVAKLETAPSFTGGRIASVFYDPVGDDHGFGELPYPIGNKILPGTLDLVRYTVHEPVYNAQWSDFFDYWQLDLDFLKPSGNEKNIRIYIDADGDGQGSTQTKVDFSEGIEFDSTSPWDYVLSVQNNIGTFESFDGSLLVTVSVQTSADKKKITLRVPLQNRILQTLYTVEITRHYVCVGAWSPWGRDGFSEVPGSEFTPKLYDILVSDDKNQEELLSAWDEENFTVPVLYPVTVRMHAASDNSSGKNMNELAERLQVLELEAKNEEEEAVRNSLAFYESLLSSSSTDLEELALAAFDAGKRVEAEKLFDQLLAKKADSAIAVAYKGSLVALRGGEAPSLVAVDIIAEAYTYLDRAVLLASNPVERITAFMNRANVSKAVPDLVFGKAQQGAEDFLSAGNELKKIASGDTGDKRTSDSAIAEAYCNAALCYQIAGKKEDAGTWYREAERIIANAESGTGANVRLAVFRYFEAEHNSAVE